jgi:hypothetical protein
VVISMCWSDVEVDGMGAEGGGMGRLCWRGCRAATAVDALLFVSQYVPGLSLRTLSVLSL